MKFTIPFAMPIFPELHRTCCVCDKVIQCGEAYRVVDGDEKKCVHTRCAESEAKKEPK